MNLEEGQIIEIDNKEYICVSSKSYQNEYYYFLMSNFKPIDVKFAKKIESNDEIKLEIVNNIEQKQTLLELFSKEIDG